MGERSVGATRTLSAAPTVRLDVLPSESVELLVRAGGWRIEMRWKPFSAGEDV
jgi:hypothetical protein